MVGINRICWIDSNYVGKYYISKQSSDKCKNKLVDQISKGDKDEVASKNEIKMMIKQLVQEEMKLSGEN